MTAACLSYEYTSVGLADSTGVGIVRTVVALSVVCSSANVRSTSGVIFDLAADTSDDSVLLRLW
jgi:hypothetical protein